MADLNALLVFAGVVEAGSFSAASRRLGMPVSTVSRQIAALEDQLGLRLIERSTRRFRVTETGGRLLEQARRGLEVSDAVDRLAAEQAVSVTGLLRVSASPGLAETLLVPVITAFAAAHPDVRVRLSVSDRPEDDLADRADLAIRTGALEDSSLIALKLRRLRNLLLASPGYLAGAVPLLRPTDLPRHRLLALADGTQGERLTLLRSGGAGRETVQVRPLLVTDDVASLVAAALADAGVCALPSMVQPDLIRDGRLLPVMPDWMLEPADLFLMHLGRRHMPRPVQLFKEMATRMVPGLCPGPPP